MEINKIFCDHCGIEITYTNKHVKIDGEIFHPLDLCAECLAIFEQFLEEFDTQTE